MNQTCNQKNCNCGRQHVYKDDLTELVKTDKDKAIGLYEERRDELKNTVKTLEQNKSTSLF